VIEGTPVVEISDLRRTYLGPGGESTHALSGVDLSVYAGELLAIVGPSGSGKSTLLQLIGCLDSPTSGSIFLRGRDVGSLQEKEKVIFRRDHIGFVFQAFYLVPSMTVLENVALSSIIRDESAVQWRSGALELLQRLGLEGTAERFPHQLSGGQKQRVAVARALFSKPEILLADEPTGNLDAANSDAVLQLIRSAVNRDTGAAGVLVTHDFHAASFADRVIAVHDGKLVDELILAREALGVGGDSEHVERVRTWMASVSL